MRAEPKEGRVFLPCHQVTSVHLVRSSSESKKPTLAISPTLPLPSAIASFSGFGLSIATGSNSFATATPRRHRISQGVFAQSQDNHRII
ncbi:MAG TPA: hypothetical protein DDW51_29995 [Cyanobacteria bacterium UBA11367]|nr:hypothetical protein [Cyanobacteria bacterium UBA11367]